MAEIPFGQFKKHGKRLEPISNDSRQSVSLKLEDTKRLSRTRLIVAGRPNLYAAKEVYGDFNTERKLRISATFDVTPWLAI